MYKPKWLEAKSFFHSHEKSETWYKNITSVYTKAVPVPIYSVLYLLRALEAFV